MTVKVSEALESFLAVAKQLIVIKIALAKHCQN
jgi:hypothetical protein